MTTDVPAPQAADTPEAASAPNSIRCYKVMAVQVPIVFNREGDHDHNGMIYALDNDENKKEFKEIRENFAAHAKSPNELVRPLVLRARCGETVEVKFTNHIRGRCVGMHLVGDGYDVITSDGAAVGANPSSLAGPPYEEGGWDPPDPHPRNEHTYSWKCDHEGVFPFHDMGNLSGGEEGTNVHGLFGTLVVEPPEAEWTDPQTGKRLDLKDGNNRCEGDGLYVDVHPKGLAAAQAREEANPWCPPQRPMDRDASFREYAVFFHDEPEFLPAHEEPEPEPCPHQVGGGHSVSGGPFGGRGAHGGGGDDHVEAELPPIMPISYRTEPMVNRERRLWRMMRENKIDPARPVVNEEQHHSSWLFGDPATPILRAYVTDPVRIRLVHGGVKETHVFHLHVYQWHANAEDVFKKPPLPCTPPNPQQPVLSPLLDSISISPQTGHTIIPLYGAGTQQGAIGDAIWHCHLYPHFHEGMWGMLRTYDRLHDASDYEQNPHLYPDGKPIPQLKPLPDRLPLPLPTDAEPGFPNFIDGKPGKKSPLPPWPEGHNKHFESPMPADLDYRPIPTAKELAHLNTAPRPGALFNWFPFPDPGSSTGNSPLARGAPEGTTCPELPADVPPVKEKELDVAVIMTEIVYNGHGWHDPQGHMYVLADAQTEEVGARKEPLILRGNQNTVVQIEFENRLPRTIGEQCEAGEPCPPPFPFDPPFPLCDFFPTPLAECGMHVHLVKFDPLVSDGASVGWNYISGPRAGKKMRYRWYVDEEFGTIFFHDHLFANFRQKRGLFGAMIAEPCGAKVLDPYGSEEMEIRSGLAGVVVPGDPKKCPQSQFEPFREFVFALADFVPLFDRHDNPLNPPNAPGHHSDQGVMAVNYRNEPIRERRGDPAYWFHSLRRSYRWGQLTTASASTSGTATRTPTSSRATPTTRSASTCSRARTRSSTASRSTACAGGSSWATAARRCATSSRWGSPRRSTSTSPRSRRRSFRRAKRRRPTARTGPATTCGSPARPTTCGWACGG
jgi:manganese oxidase